MSSFYGNCSSATEGGSGEGGGGSTGFGTAIFTTSYDEITGEIIYELSTINGLTSFETYISNYDSKSFAEPAVLTLNNDEDGSVSVLSTHYFTAWGTGYAEQFLFTSESLYYTTGGLPSYTTSQMAVYRVRYDDGDWGDWTEYLG